ncbi:MAG: glycoside hydrolase family 30 beta sandwich domain-containing protein, partial [Robiginitalea sp.]|nr:glycoside hydrolase family 30 beta sandwich domain-containing protein [Robiginitalea sp.]
PNADEPQDIKITGLNVRPKHAVAEYDEGSGAVTLSPVDGSKTFINGELLSAPRQLEAGDRIIFGNNFVFRFHHPAAENPDGSIAVVVLNQGSEPKNFSLVLGEKATEIQISGQALQTIIIDTASADN